ncbi:tetratricopeptide repeat protein [Streptomyces sp. TLI_146]|uniref:tetratricopeptide repeat protein n=1 Tax=Streptomyces sp. TLI_146 TaxID=1938858 RepID=UPI0015D606E6|nr:tetratricopeptide repeat protein [Streptomyces sp. TLI_146]
MRAAFALSFRRLAQVALVKGDGLPPPDVELAGALDNLSRALGDLGLHTAALAQAREGVEIRRRQVASAPGGYEAMPADAVVNLAAHLLATGDTAGAMEHAHEGVALYRQLAAESPHGSGPDLANALGTLGLCCARAGRWAAAREAHAEATAVLGTPACPPQTTISWLGSQPTVRVRI